MIESILVTIFPLGFLIVLFGGGELMRRRNIDMGGAPPIAKTLFLSSKYAIIILWTAMVLQGWRVDLAWLALPELWHWVALVLWVLGFGLLFMGRLGLGRSFRIGSPQEGTGLKVDGLFSCSRNPMYLGVYLTLLAVVLYTLNPLLLLLAIFVAGVHHQIVLAEEDYLRKVFGKEFMEYCRRVRRYL